jgi:hypothetical protein
MYPAGFDSLENKSLMTSKATGMVILAAVSPRDDNVRRPEVLAMLLETRVMKGVGSVLNLQVSRGLGDRHPTSYVDSRFSACRLLPGPLQVSR